MKLLQKYYTRKFIKYIDKDIKVKFGKRLECEPETKTLYVSFKSDKVDQETFMEYIKELDKTCELNDLVLGILHEIGHIYTHDESLEDDYNQCIEILSKLFKEKKINDYDMNRYYIRLELEARATQWAIDFAKLNKSFCKNFQKRLDKVSENMVIL